MMGGGKEPPRKEYEASKRCPWPRGRKRWPGETARRTPGERLRVGRHGPDEHLRDCRSTSLGDRRRTRVSQYVCWHSPPRHRAERITRPFGERRRKGSRIPRHTNPRGDGWGKGSRIPRHTSSLGDRGRKGSRTPRHKSPLGDGWRRGSGIQESEGS